VFFGRFITLLRIFAGPLAGSLRMPYGRFPAANASGGIVWATGMTYLIWFLGVAAERWLTRFSWLALIAAVTGGVVITLLVKRKTAALARRAEAEASAARGGQRTGPGRRPIFRKPTDSRRPERPGDREAASDAATGPFRTARGPRSGRRAGYRQRHRHTRPGYSCGDGMETAWRKRQSAADAGVLR
jgi:hypothetical protein